MEYLLLHLFDKSIDVPLMFCKITPERIDFSQMCHPLHSKVSINKYEVVVRFFVDKRLFLIMLSCMECRIKIEVPIIRFMMELHNLLLLTRRNLCVVRSH